MANIQKQSRLTFIKNTIYGSNPKALYRCTCGNIKKIRVSSVVNFTTVSCGCYKREQDYKHGLTKHPLYKIWGGIKDRCYKKTNSSYKKYGKRGVKMCDEWKHNFKLFYDWAIVNGWSKGLHIDKDKKGDGFLYSPETCSILTCKENNQYRINTPRIQYNGNTYTFQGLCELYNINNCTVRDRIKTGMTLKDALETPLRK